MAVIKKLLPHQAAFLQAPHVFPEIRFVFMICGYGAGKTSSLIDGLCYWISRYQETPFHAVCINAYLHEKDKRP